MIDFSELGTDGEVWELFARDFLQEVGFYIESTPDRGNDHGKDMLVSEELSGNLGKYKFKWLVSCKNFATSNRAVNESDEQNILERVKSFKADGFIGFYSTIASSNLNKRLYDLRENKEIKDYKVFDHKLIENYLIRIGFSKLLMRYLPDNYKKIKPLHLIIDEYLPLECSVCGKDLLPDLYNNQYGSNIVFVKKIERNEDFTIEKTTYEDVYWACKGECDRELEKRYVVGSGCTSSWEDIGDMIKPTVYLRYIFSIMNTYKNKSNIITEVADEKIKYFFTALGQKVLREMTEKERDRVKDLFEYGLL